MSHTHVDRAIALLYPETGRRARDVKFLVTSGVTQEQLAEQVITCFAVMQHASSVISSVDHN